MYPTGSGEWRTLEESLDLLVAGARLAFGEDVVVQGGEHPATESGYYLVDTVPREYAVTSACLAGCTDPADLATLLRSAEAEPLDPELLRQFQSIVVVHRGEKFFLRGRAKL
jgi:hypothetical protein